MIKIKSVYDINSSEYEACSKLVLSNGMMWDVFNDERTSRNSKAKVALYYLRGKIIGWGLLFYIGLEEYNYFLQEEIDALSSKLKNIDHVGHIYLFVDPQYRRRGYGGSILKRLKKLHRKNNKDKPMVYNHDQISAAFYNKQKSLVVFKC